MILPYLQLDQLSVRINNNKILDNIHLILYPGEQWAITGPSGSGKTILAHTITGRYFFNGSILFNGQPGFRPSIQVVNQQNRFKNLSNTSDFYYQQRYNATEAEDSITVEKFLDISSIKSGTLTIGIKPADIPGLLHLDHILQEPLIQLSNGENKRLQIAKALLEAPQLLILDNPYTGLDSEGRDLLTGIINKLTKPGINLLLITTASEIPDGITHVASMEKGKLIAAGPKGSFNPSQLNFPAEKKINQDLLKKINPPLENNFQCAVQMVDVNVRYGDRIILKNINWEVRKGECWSLSGSNGSGKSTLLSLVTGDNAQAYANEIYLFDQRRGSGESIWDIKRKIGFVSPEIHLYFDRSLTCSETIASGLFDTIGLFRTLTEAQSLLVSRWTELFQLNTISNKLFSSLSIGEQRLVLLARALVKNPPLLILDEPCQGLDTQQVNQFKQLINEICLEFNTTLIYVSHYKDELPGCVNKFLHIKNGEASVSFLH